MTINQPLHILNETMIETPLGPMVAIADEDHLYFLEFEDRVRIAPKIKRLCLRMKARLIPGTTEPISTLKKELDAYFQGKLKTFKTPLFLLGSDFQKDTWGALLEVPYGETRSYAAQAACIGQPLAFRAVANANGANHFAIVIPCHRIINRDGKLGGYGGGLTRKEWLLHHERKHKNA